MKFIFGLLVIVAFAAVTLALPGPDPEAGPGAERGWGGGGFGGGGWGGGGYGGGGWGGRGGGGWGGRGWGGREGGGWGR